MSLAAPNLNDILLGLFDELGELKYGVATGGSSTTLVDSGIGGSDNDWNSGTALIVGAGSAAPEGEFAEVTAYTASTGTLTATFSAAPAATDEYALASKKYPLAKVKGLVNRGLVRMGGIPATDETLTAATSTTEYTIPAAAIWGLRRVYIAQSSTASNELWVEQTAWRAEDGILIFRRQPMAGVIKLVYMGLHTRLTKYSDTLDSSVALNRAVAEAFYIATTDPLRRIEGPGSAIKRQMEDAQAELKLARGKYPIWDPGTPFKPILSGRKGKRRSGRYGSYYT